MVARWLYFDGEVGPLLWKDNLEPQRPTGERKRILLTRLHILKSHMRKIHEVLEHLVHIWVWHRDWLVVTSEFKNKISHSIFSVKVSHDENVKSRSFQIAIPSINIRIQITESFRMLLEYMFFVVLFYHSNCSVLSEIIYSIEFNWSIWLLLLREFSIWSKIQIKCYVIWWYFLVEAAELLISPEEYLMPNTLIYLKWRGINFWELKTISPNMEIPTFLGQKAMNGNEVNRINVYLENILNF